MMQRKNVIVPKQCSCQSDCSECNNGEGISHIHIREHSRLNYVSIIKFTKKGAEELFSVKGDIRNVTSSILKWILD